MKILLLTDIPPCHGYTAGLVLDQLCRFLPRETIACFTVHDPSIPAALTPDLDWMPHRTAIKPMENAWRILPSKLGVFTARARELRNERRHIPRLADEIAEFGREFGADTVWCVLQGQTMIRLAEPVADRLSARLRTLVWDPFEWWMRDRRVDRFTRKSVERSFGGALKRSESCAVASWAMGEKYSAVYGGKYVPVISSRDESWVQPPGEALHNKEEVTIGIAGQLYASSEWGNLLLTLEKSKWRIEGRKVKIRMLGPSAKVHASTPANFEYLGWHNQPETIRLMSEADILYLPYWTDPEFEMEARLSFPSKLVSYLAAGRPVMFHGPEYASPARFLAKHEAALNCYTLENTKIYDTLARMVLDVDLYRNLSVNGRRAFDEYFTLARMRESFAEFLGVDSSFMLPVG